MLLFGCPLPCGLVLGPELEILGTVVVTDAVLVVDVIGSQKLAAEHLFHDEAVLQDVPLLGSWSHPFGRVGIPDPDIPALPNAATAPVGGTVTVVITGMFTSPEALAAHLPTSPSDLSMEDAGNVLLATFGAGLDVRSRSRMDLRPTRRVPPLASLILTVSRIVGMLHAPSITLGKCVNSE